MNSFQKAGLLCAASGFITVIGIISAEAVATVYQTHSQVISDLARYTQAGPVFNSAMILSGLCAAIASVFLIRQAYFRFFSVLLLANGIGILGVGLFPIYTGAAHQIFAGITFGTGALMALVHARSDTSALRYFSLWCGMFSFASMIFFFWTQTFLGVGGAERLISYSNTIWLIALGGWLIHYTMPKDMLNFTIKNR
jgi:hypothetical membrane protein